MQQQVCSEFEEQQKQQQQARHCLVKLFADSSLPTSPSYILPCDIVLLIFQVTWYHSHIHLNRVHSSTESTKVEYKFTVALAQFQRVHNQLVWRILTWQPTLKRFTENQVHICDAQGVCSKCNHFATMSPRKDTAVVKTFFVSFTSCFVKLYKLLCQTAEVCKKPVWGMIIRYRSQLCSVLASSQATDLKKLKFYWLIDWILIPSETISITHCSGADWGITPASHFTITPKGCSRRWFKKTNCRTEQS